MQDVHRSCKHTHTHTHTNTHTHTQTHTHKHIQTHTHTHTKYTHIASTQLYACTNTTLHIAVTQICNSAVDYKNEEFPRITLIMCAYKHTTTQYK